MIPVIAIVGRPNVGKSTLFNRLTRTRNALVGDVPGLTRDRQYGEGFFEDRSYILVDTGGLEIDLAKTQAKSKPVKAAPLVEALMTKQALQAVEEADAILFLVDARAGLNVADENIALFLRKSGKPIFVVVNKIDDFVKHEEKVSEFYRLGLGELQAISAEHNLGIANLMESVFAVLPTKDNDQENALDKTKKVISKKDQDGIKIAFVGRPNVGKSTLVNRILGEERVVVCDLPGTTRDSIFVPFVREDRKYILIDTAGVRRKGKVELAYEKFSVIKTLRAIAAAEVVVVMLDAQVNLVEQDLWLLGFVLDAGKALVIAVNKWDNLSSEKRSLVEEELERRLDFVDFAKIHFISALHGSGVHNLFASIDQAYHAASRKLDTPELTAILQEAIAAHEPPLVRGRRIKMRYAHAGGRKPPVIVIHGNQLRFVSKDYQRYLINFFRKSLNLFGTPIRVEFKSGKNPYDRNK